MGDTSALLDQQASIGVTSDPRGFNVTVDRGNTRQTIEGYGASMTNAGAYVIYHSPHRHDIMRDLFGNGTNELGLYVGYMLWCCTQASLLSRPVSEVYFQRDMSFTLAV